MVWEADFAAASEVLRLPSDENHRCLYRCPKCAGENVQELGLDEGFGVGLFSLVLTLGLVAAARVFGLRRHGRSYRCLDCGTRYRQKP